MLGGSGAGQPSLSSHGLIPAIIESLVEPEEWGTGRAVDAYSPVGQLPVDSGNKACEAMIFRQRCLLRLVEFP